MRITARHERFITTNIAKHILVFNFNKHDKKICCNHYVSFSESGCKREDTIGQWNVKLKSQQ